MEKRKVSGFDWEYMLCFFIIGMGLTASLMVFGWVGLLFWIGIALGIWGGVAATQRYLRSE